MTVIAMAQMNPTVGGIESNTAKIIQAAKRAQKQGADLVVFPELVITGYPPEDLLFRDELHERVELALETICEHFEDSSTAIVVGAPIQEGQDLRNSAVWIEAGEIRAVYHKRHLPNYGVFDEKRYFKADRTPVVVEFQGTKFGLAVCEDVWRSKAVRKSKEAGADVILALNASPYHYDKHGERLAAVRERIKDVALPIVYVNQIGGQDELIFDGESFVMNAEGQRVFNAPNFVEGEYYVEYKQGQWTARSMELPRLTEEEQIYRALVMGVQDYVHKNGFKGALLGLSGGIDSALVLALAVDALGKDNVQAVMMPSEYTASMSLQDAEAEAVALGVEYNVVEINPMFESFKTGLAPVLENHPPSEWDVTDQNLQARSRGVLLMAISNRKGYLVLPTGNKSEMAVGYATLYGDMAGGFAPLKDVPKTMVYRLSKFRNTVSPVIPERVIIRPPSAELAPDQKDEDNLPPYDILDAILEKFVEESMSASDIIAEGFDEDTVEKVIRLVTRNEYKRRQAAPGIKITQKAFGRERRYPITSSFFN